MIVTSTIRPGTFDDKRVPPDLTELNAYLRAEHAKRPDPWSIGIAEARQARIEGKGIFPPARPDPHAELRHVPVPGAPDVQVRIITPRTQDACGTFVHIHGGGWLFGQAVESDPRLRTLAEAAGLATVSIDYRLAPEDRFPAAFDDCLAVARALLDGSLGLPMDFLAIGGESAGAHLSVITLMRLRDEDGVSPFRAANLVAGFYDLSLTPSAGRPGHDRIVINADDLARFVELSLPEGASPRDPRYSPIYGDLHSLAPARFSCGSVDRLHDDTFLMAHCWARAANETQLSITTGGCHVFEAFDTRSGAASVAAADAWIIERMAAEGL